MCFSNRIYQISFERESNLSSMLFLCLYTHALRHIGPYSLYIYIYIYIYKYIYKLAWWGRAWTIRAVHFILLVFIPFVSPPPVTTLSLACHRYHLRFLSAHWLTFSLALLWVFQPLLFRAAVLWVQVENWLPHISVSVLHRDTKYPLIYLHHELQ